MALLPAIAHLLQADQSVGSQLAGGCIQEAADDLSLCELTSTLLGLLSQAVPGLGSIT